jgi:hypothetical protein
MGIEIKKGNQQSSMGRRLFAMAAPVVGGAIGGPAGAAMGSMLGSKMSGASTEDAVMGGVKAGMAQGVAGGAETATKTGAGLPGMPSPNEAMPTVFGRRMAMKAEDPAAAIQGGMSVLESLPPGHPLKQELAPVLLQTQFAKPKGF